MKTIHIHTTFAKLAALALLAASCTDQYDPAEVSPAAMAGAPIAISVAPPPAFTEVNATTRGNTAAANDRQPATRASQTDEGTKWEAGDILWLKAEFFKDKATADTGAPADVIQISVLKYAGTNWRPLSRQEAVEFDVTSLPGFVSQLHWPKEVMKGTDPMIFIIARHVGNEKPDTNGNITIPSLNTSRISAASYGGIHDASIELKFAHMNSRLRIPAGYRAELAHAYYWATFHPSRWEISPLPINEIPAQDIDTDVLLKLYNQSTVKLIREKDNTTYTYTYTFPSITDAEGEATQNGASYTLTPYSNGTEAPLTPGTYDLLISNEKELRDFAEKVNKNETIEDGLNGRVLAREAKVLQTANITLGSEEWTPIGGQSPFRGRYNGNGHTIENMKITKGIQVDAGYGKDLLAGMFHSTVNAVLTGINLRNVKIDINADNTMYGVKVGCLVGETGYSTISLCSATGQVTVIGDAAGVHTGGIIGSNYLSTISRCRAAVDITATNTNAKGTANAGGIVGHNAGFILSSEAQDRTVTANNTYSANAGGIAAANESNNGYIAFCRAGNAVYAKNGSFVNRTGGLIGANIGYLYASYAHPNAMATSSGGSNDAGVLVGDNNRADRVKHCYGAGKASPDNSNLKEAPDNIVYNRNPAAGEILTLMQMHKDAVESLPGNPTLVLTTTRYDPSASPAYGIEPIRVKWTSRAWKQGSDPKYPEIDREYQGE